MHNLPGLEEFILDQFNELGDDLRVHSDLNKDNLIDVTIYYRLDGIKHRLDLVMVGFVVSDGLATDTYDTDNYNNILDGIRTI